MTVLDWSKVKPETVQVIANLVNGDVIVGVFIHRLKADPNKYIVLGNDGQPYIANDIIPC